MLPFIFSNSIFKNYKNKNNLSIYKIYLEILRAKEILSYTVTLKGKQT
jgi:hypothetical protein